MSSYSRYVKLKDQLIMVSIPGHGEFSFLLDDADITPGKPCALWPAFLCEARKANVNLGDWDWPIFGAIAYAACACKKTGVACPGRE